MDSPTPSSGSPLPSDSPTSPSPPLVDSIRRCFGPSPPESIMIESSSMPRILGKKPTPMDEVPEASQNERNTIRVAIYGSSIVRTSNGSEEKSLSRCRAVGGRL
ncbi:hypothetical protein QJS10_CPB17g02400 [Acorus calamus]|uniref:Uncharacterized protein n=1 Tax=Acorus calamus TaxID=4465 RepID=A0AAV9CUP4_ACOCL|nr:hypothetical protein QJS10_CPB17g02400 [Acorus calamus]